MKVLFVSNDLTHHLVPFFESLILIYGKENCTFAVLEPCDGRHKMGFPAYSEPWVFVAYERPQIEYLRLWEKADIIITRVWDDISIINKSLQKGKFVFYASERWLKPSAGKMRLLVPSYLFRLIRFRQLSKYDNFFYLAMGYYAASDFNFLGLCKNRIFNFGYFTPSFHRPTHVGEGNKKSVEILWAGRMLGWKHVDDLLMVFKDLVNLYDVNLTLIGDGPERQELIRYSNSNNIPNITFKKFVPNAAVKNIMQDIDIYVLPSSGYEGWGAVINEAMQTKCAVIASQEAGAARSMIKDGVNGLTFPAGNRKELKKALVKLLENRKLLNRLKEEGYRTITEIWSATEAAKRFKTIVDNIQNESSIDVFTNGPMQLLR